jgi:molybdopterin/thiamine biosynthesis adenylyltransferase
MSVTKKKKSEKTMKQQKVKVIGCGGIGGCVLKILPRYLAFQKEFVPELFLIDGDSYEPRNMERQEFSRPGNKAEVASEMIRASMEVPLEVWWHGEYVTKDNVLMHVREDDVVFLCVDNHATRKLISDRCNELQNVVLVSGGNDYRDGNIQIHIRKDGKDITLPIANQFHREILDPKDDNPGEHRRGCDQQHESAPQLLITNNYISALMLNAYYGYTQGAFDNKFSRYDEVYGDVVVNRARPVQREEK